MAGLTWLDGTTPDAFRAAERLWDELEAAQEAEWRWEDRLLDRLAHGATVARDTVVGRTRIPAGTVVELVQDPGEDLRLYLVGFRGCRMTWQEAAKLVGVER